MSGSLTSGTWERILGTWGRPPDIVAWVSLFGAAFLLLRSFGGSSELLSNRSRKNFLLVIGFSAAFLSLGYVAFYLRGGPRIIDATSYWLEARALSHGLFTWTVPEPTASFRGRFLLFRPPDELAGIFPPGYPLVLALGFLVGAPMVIGPLLAAAIAIATWWLAREITALGSHPARTVELTGRIAACVSLACAALRYHTADTMSHGAAALAVTSALASVLAARRTGERGWLLLSGLALGWLASTRFASVFAVGAVTLMLTARNERSPSAFFSLALGTLPGIALLALANAKALGSIWAFPQQAYYALSDGPSECFRYGFGRGVGCLVEHEEAARKLGASFDLLDAALTTGRRLRLHLVDVANFEPLLLLLAVPLRQLRQNRGIAAAVAVVVGQIAAYAPFYFDGSYPGGGARFFADVLPLEHALLAFAIATVGPLETLVRRTFLFLAAMLVGFSVHASFGHRSLQERDGGHPMFVPDVVHKANVTSGVLFVDTDHGFNLAHDPGVSASHGILVARKRGDDHDRVLLDRLGRPPSYEYARGDGGVPTELPRYTPSPGLAYRFEAEADWPPLSQRGGWAEPAWTDPCASGSRVLRIHPANSDTPAEVRIELPVPRQARWGILPRVVLTEGNGRAELLVERPGKDTVPVATWSNTVGPADSGQASTTTPVASAPLRPDSFDAGPAAFLADPGPDGHPSDAGWLPLADGSRVGPSGQLARCVELPTVDIELYPPSAVLVLRAFGQAVSLDRTTLILR